MKRIFLLLLGGFMCMLTVSGWAATGAAVHHKYMAQHKVSKSINSPVDINTASQKELEGLTGLGVKKAAAIVAYRNEHGHFKSIDDLAQVSGIGSKMLQRLEKKNPNRMTVNKTRQGRKS